MAWVDSVPWIALVILAVMMMIVPVGASHFVEKWRMLFAGTLRRPLDWFDLVLHSAPLVLLLLKAAVSLRRG